MRDCCRLSMGPLVDARRYKSMALHPIGSPILLWFASRNRVSEETQVTIDVGLVGFGFAGRVFHAPIIAAVPGLRLRAIVQRSGDTAASLYSQATVVGSIEELLTIEDLRLVVIATPNTSHYGLTKQCRSEE